MTNVDRKEAMAGSLERIARSVGLGDEAIAHVGRAFELAMGPRVAALDEHHPSFLHPGRSALVLLQDVGPLPSPVLAAATAHESEEAGLRVSHDDVRRRLGDEVAEIVTSLPLPGDEELVARLITLEEGPRLAALAERLDHLRHAHLREDRAWWAALRDETAAAWAPVAERTHPRLADRYRAWLRAIGRRLGVVVALALIGASAGGAQQGRIDVRVRSSGAPVAGAEVVAGEARALTNVEGEASLALVAGRHELAVSALGYATAERTVAVTAGASVSIDVELEVEAVDVEEILVLSTRTERRIEDVPLRVEVVAREMGAARRTRVQRRHAHRLLT